MYVLGLLFSIFISFMYLVVSVNDNKDDGVFIAITLLVLAAYDLYKKGDLSESEEPWYRQNNYNKNNTHANNNNKYSGVYDDYESYSYGGGYSGTGSHNNYGRTTGAESAKLLGDMSQMKNKDIKIEVKTKNNNGNK